MINIYTMIVNSDEDYAYVFEDDINMLEDIKLDEIVEYEKISPIFFYLGLCKYNGEEGITQTSVQINNNPVYNISGGVRGLHAIGLSKKGAEYLINLANGSGHIYMDMILEDFSRIHPANIVRYDLVSYIPSHKGIIFQDRNRFPSMIPN